MDVGGGTGWCGGTDVGIGTGAGAGAGVVDAEELDVCVCTVGTNGIDVGAERRVVG